MWIINTHFLVDNVESQKQGVTKGREYVWFMLMFDRKQQNSVKQLFFNKK